MVADQLRNEISSGRLNDGDALRQDELAVRLGISKIPVREGLRLLEAQGLVKFLPNRGVVVAGMSPEEAQEITEMRLALETTVLRKAADNFGRDDVRRATRILEDLEFERVAARQSALNWDFHAAMYAPAKRPRQLLAIHDLHVLVDRYMRLVLSDLKHHRQSQHEHRAILDACAAHQAGRAVRLLTDHIESAAQLMIAFLRDRRTKTSLGDS